MKSPAERLTELLKLHAEEIRKCKLCGMQLYFVRLPKTYKHQAYTSDGTPHIENCSYLKPPERKSEQAALLETAPLPE